MPPRRHRPLRPIPGFSTPLTTWFLSAQPRELGRRAIELASGVCASSKVRAGDRAGSSSATLSQSGMEVVVSLGSEEPSQVLPGPACAPKYALDVWATLASGW